MRMLRRLLILSCLFSTVQLSGAAQKKQEPLPIEVALSMHSFPSLMPIQLSRDGQLVAYTLHDDLGSTMNSQSGLFTHTGVPFTSIACEVWIADTKSGENIRPTGGMGTSWGPAWSPDGQQLAFYSDRSGQANLWVWERSTGKSRQVSEAVVHPFLPFEVPSWSVDERKILLKVLPEAAAVDGPSSGDDNTSKKTGGLSSEKKPKAIVYGSSDHTAQTRSSRMQDPRSGDLALIDVATGKVKRIATGLSAVWYALSPDGAELGVVSFKGPENASSKQSLYDLFLVSLQNGLMRKVAQDIRFWFATSVSWSPDGKYLSYIETGPTAQGECFIVPIKEGGKARKATDFPHPAFVHPTPHYYPFQPPVWDAKGENIYGLSPDGLWRLSLVSGKAIEVAKFPNPRVCVEVVGARSGRFWSPDGGRSIYVITRNQETMEIGVGKLDLATGKYDQVLEEDKDYGTEPLFYSMDVSADGTKMVYLAQDAQHSLDVWGAGAEFRNRRRITQANPQFDSYALGESRLIAWRSNDGQKSYGALLLPPDYERGKRFPLIVYPYPGAYRSQGVNQFGSTTTSDGIENMQVLASQGYVVFLPDAPAEIGGEYVKKFVNAVMTGVDQVIDLGVADPDRIGVMGFSNGGYGVLALITQTTRFRAAIARGSFGNLFGIHSWMAPDGTPRGLSDVEQTRMGGSPWEYRSRYIENSPFFYLDRVQTPLLLIHGSLDEAVPAFLADETYVCLQRLGKEVVYAKYEGEGHWEGRWSYPNQIDYWNRIISWFDKYLRGPNRKTGVSGRQE